ncbi:hypothetical protein INT46_004927 [Mucor plumbeus]|uniref:Anaphase-promoting complex subunit 11 n=1 Tax=Mucor plumbeus TaxID=97098 RepID=A0A8H7QD67_9FUNG|nr:hypothetical protein INT46_004927 [Mucor plumbeus]
MIDELIDKRKSKVPANAIKPQLRDNLFLYQKWSNNQTIISNLFEHELLQNKMKINVVSWTMAAQWSWDVKEGDDVCGICHSEYDGCCPTCKRPGDDCPLIWGECSHVFHLHCIMTWFQSSTRGETCPMDRTPWQTAKAPLQ